MPLEFQERAYLVACRVGRQQRSDAQDSLEELRRLTESAGAAVVGETLPSLPRMSSHGYLGKGKTEEVALEVGRLGAHLVVLDEDLTPSQQRNLEDAVGVKVLDRTGLILDIFAQRAKTREAQLEVELAQLVYLLPRLTGHGELMSRLGGGIGARGPGEQKLEMDRRRIRGRITRIRRSLEEVRRTRGLHRETRRGVPIRTFSLVGYTNAGKSTLMNALTHAGVVAEDQLFSTLDTRVRALRLPGGLKVLLGDTVGFLRKLPHSLVEAFKSTLEEVREAQFLLHVIDVTHPRFREQVRAVREVLEEIGASEKPVLHVLNKVDRLDTRVGLKALESDLDPAVAVSARTGEGIDRLLQRMAERLASERCHVSLRVPLGEIAALAPLRRTGRIEQETYEDGAVRIEAEADRIVADRLKRFRIERGAS